MSADQPAEKKIDVKIVKKANTIIDNTTQRAIPSKGESPQEKDLTQHQRDALRDVLRKGFKQEAQDETIEKVIDVLGPVLGEDR